MRRRGLDPAEERLAMRRLTDEVVLDYDERALSSTMPPLPNPRQAARAVCDAVAGFGPLQRHLDESEIEEIWFTERLDAGLRGSRRRRGSQRCRHGAALSAASHSELGESARGPWSLSQDRQRRVSGVEPAHA
jgi:hypothetical protein